MGMDAVEVNETPLTHLAIKVHRPMCMELIKFVTRVSKLLPEIEAARPRCSSGIEALCLLNNAIVKAKTLLQQCSESSKLYLALTGDVILSRCKKSRELLDRSLSQVINMVPILLAEEIWELIGALRRVTFSLDPSEEEAGKVVKGLLQKYVSTTDSSEEYAVDAIQVAMWRLDITSLRNLVIEKRSIKKMLEGESMPTKRKILLLFLNLLNKHGKSVVTERTEHGSPQQNDSFPITDHPEATSCLRLHHDDAQVDFLGRSTMHGVTVPDPSMEAAVAHSLESSYNSVASLSNSMNDLLNPMDFDNLSRGSLDASPASQAKTPNDFDEMSREGNDSFHQVQSGLGMQEMDLNPLTRLSSLSWESQCIWVGNISNIFRRKNQAYDLMSSEDFVQTIITFLKDAHDYHDLNAQLLGYQSLLTVLQQCRSNVPHLNDDAFALLASFLGTEVSKEALAILKVLSCHQHCHEKIAASGAVTPIIEMFDAQNRESQELAIKTLCNLSGNSIIISLITASEFIPKLIPYLEDTALARDTLIILKNLCITEDATASVAETDGCIPSVVKLLDSDSREDQEHAVALLLSLCSQCVQYCPLIMEELVFPGLVTVSVNGNSKGKAMALQLLALLSVQLNNNGKPSSSDVDIPNSSTIDDTQQKSSSKAQGIFRKLFSKQGSSSSAKSKK